MGSGVAGAQNPDAQNRRAMNDNGRADTPQRPLRTRLILKDGTYQLVLSYRVEGSVVRFRSAERNGEAEEIPLELVDIPATERWAAQHAANPGRSGIAEGPGVLSPELAREEADRAARTPEVAPDLRLPEEDSLLVLDTFRAKPELVPLAQQGSDLNKETAHATQAAEVNPSSSPHRLTDVPGERADVQLHVQDPVFFVHIGRDDAALTGGGAITVDTHGQSGANASTFASERSTYVIERVDVRQGLRQVDTFRPALLGSGREQTDVIETRAEMLPGGHWMKLTPARPLGFGEYALVEVLSPRTLNVDVWDFGVHPEAKENTEAIHSEQRRPAQLERRR